MSWKGVREDRGRRAGLPDLGHGNLHRGDRPGDRVRFDPGERDDLDPEERGQLRARLEAVRGKGFELDLFHGLEEMTEFDMISRHRSGAGSFICGFFVEMLYSNCSCVGHFYRSLETIGRAV